MGSEEGNSFRKSSNEKRILSLGASTTFGLSDCTYPKYLEQQLNSKETDYDYRVINGGVEGYTSLQVRAL